jgi:hypothetical protein
MVNGDYQSTILPCSATTLRSLIYPHAFSLTAVPLDPCGEASSGKNCLLRMERLHFSSDSSSSCRRRRSRPMECFHIRDILFPSDCGEDHIESFFAVRYNLASVESLCLILFLLGHTPIANGEIENESTTSTIAHKKPSNYTTPLTDSDSKLCCTQCQSGLIDDHVRLSIIRIRTVS